MKVPARPAALVIMIWVALAAILIMGAVGGLIAFESSYDGRAYPGVRMQGTDLGGMTPEEIFRAAQSKATFFYSPILTLKITGRIVNMRPADFGVALDPAATAQRALDIGRQGDLLKRLRTQAETWWFGADVAPVVLLDEPTAQRMLQRIAAEIRREPQNASFHFENGVVQETPGATGASLNITTSLALIQAAISNGKRADLTLPVDAQQPQVVSVALAVKAAKRIISQDLVVMAPRWDVSDKPIAGQEAFRIRGVDLTEFLNVEQQMQGSELLLNVTLRRDKLRPMIEKLSPAVARPVQNAQFVFNDATSALENIKPSTTGRALNVEATLDSVEQALRGDQRQVSLVVNDVVPTVNTNATGAQLGITQLITQATTYFKGSSAARLTNVKVAAARFHGLVIAPHATFSFNEWLGDVSTEEGFEVGLVIVGDRTIKGVGGGVCQVSTTAYQAALRAGFPIEERYPHGYRVSYYERGMGPGFDATVFSPYVDLKFVNDSDFHLLIETYFDQARATLTFKFYGTRDGRQVTFTEPVITDIVPHGPDIYEADPDNEVPAGQAKKVDYAVDGARISVSRTVTRNGEVLIQQKIVSKYVAWQAIYRYGPGFTPPEGAIVR